MDQATMSAAICEIQRCLGPMESCSVSVQDALTDHAGHIDHGRANIEGMRVFAGKFREQLVAAKVERDQIRVDLVTACERVDAKYVALKADSEKFQKILEKEVERLTSSRADAPKQTVGVPSRRQDPGN